MSTSQAASSEEKPMSLTGLLSKAQNLMQKEEELRDSQDMKPGDENDNTKNPLVEALEILEKLQHQIQHAAIFSVNESLTDVQTSSLPLLGVEYHMAKAYLQVRTTSSKARYNNVKRAVELFHLFLHRCDTFEDLLKDTIQQQYKALPEMNHDDEEEMPSKPLPSPSRDEKIARFKESKEIKAKLSHMNAQVAQRKRLDLQEHEEMEGHDEDSLMRSLYLCQLNTYALDAFEEINSSSMEFQMLQMAVKMEKERNHMNQYRGVQAGGRGHPQSSQPQRRPMINDPTKKMQMTQVLQDPMTGQLIFKKQEIQSQVFRPSWNQPTMSLDELAEKEIKEAMEREARQKVSEENAKNAPRRYEYLVRDGMEDNVDLVDASAKLDREWDDWKDENPRGSGNKMGDRGDRNF